MPPSSSSAGGSSQRQATLLGFFGKLKSGPAPASTPRMKPADTTTSKTTPAGSKHVHSDVASTLNTPPPSATRSTRPDGGSTSNELVSSPTQMRSNAIAASRHTTSKTSSAMLEMTPPSSSPVAAQADGEDEEDEEMIARPSRRRTSQKRAVNYAESEDEMQGVSGVNDGDDDDDDSDRYSPQEERRPSKKFKRRGGRSASSSSDDEFDDFILPDNDELEALEEEAARRTTQARKGTTKTVQVTKNPPTTQTGKTSSSSGRTISGSASSTSLTRGSSGNGNASGKYNANVRKESPSEQPYDFLLHPLDENRNPPNHPDYDKRTLFIPENVMSKLTPFEKQFWAIKRKHNDTVLFFQKGKFYELYEDDAVIAHREFGLKMTDRVRMKMAGVPESSFTTFANKFLALGYKVGRVDQSETAVAMSMRKGGTMIAKGPATANGDDNKIVRRELKHIYTNGTIVDADCLPDEMSSYCVSIKEVIYDPVSRSSPSDKDDESLSLVPMFGICFLDAGVAKFNVRQFEDDVSRTQFETLLRSLRIKEVIHEKGGLSKRSLRILRNTVPHDCNITMLRPHSEFYDAEQTLRKLNLVYNPALQSDASSEAPCLEAVDPVDPSILPEGIQQVIDKPIALSALGGMLNYLTQLNLDKDVCASRNFDIFDPETQQSCMLLDAQSLAHLNVLMNEQGDTQGTLLGLVNRATTPFGKRLMRIWLLAPLAKLDLIRGRQEAVEALLRDTSFQDDFDVFARSLPDIERIMPRISAGNCKSRDFAKILKALARVDENIELLAERAGTFDTDVVQALIQSIPAVSDIAREIQHMYQDESFEPRSGCDDKYDAADEEVNMVERSLQKELQRAATTVKLSRDRVKFKDVGTNEIYQIEVPIKTKVPLDWALVSQTQSVKRYYSPEVRQLVKKLKEGRETRLAALKEFQSRLFERFEEKKDFVLSAVKGIAELDCLVSLAKASYAIGEPSCRPEFVESDTALVEFQELRHPCMAGASMGEFIANDVALGGAHDHEGGNASARVTILTGGNMAGKSTTARTTATAVILAQLGCRVPARSACLSPIDRIASRMGANDQLFRNNSTFMVEMLEASRILKDCTPRSLVIMDELGRGTSTFDGQAIAYAVLHHLIGRTRCLSFFLTHYTALAHEFEGRYGVANKHMQVLVDSDLREVIFTYKLVPGIAESSYGTEVAALAGVPVEICERATRISREFAATTKEAEAQRLHRLGDALNVAALSDFALLFKAGSQAEQGDTVKQVARAEKMRLDGQALAFLRRQIATVIDARKDGGVKTAVSEGQIDAEVVNNPRRRPAATYGQRGRSKLSMHAECDLDSDSEGEEARRKSGTDVSTSLNTVSTGAAPAVSAVSSRRDSKPTASQRRVPEQMTLDLGQKLRIDCQACGMSYDRSDEGDVTMHKRFHRDAIEGMEWKVRDSAASRCIATHTIPSGAAERQIVEIWAYDVSDRARQQDAATWRSLQRVQDRMDVALGAIATQLGVARQTEIHEQGSMSASSPYRQHTHQRTMLVAVCQNRVVGSALVGSVNKTSVRRVDPTTAASSDSVVIENAPLALEQAPPLGVHRIYVMPSMRRNGLAHAMLDAALDDCVYGMRAEQIIATYGHGSKANAAAFSQPTYSGRLLAQAWITAGSSNDTHHEQAPSLLIFEDDA